MGAAFTHTLKMRSESCRGALFNKGVIHRLDSLALWMNSQMSELHA